VPCFRYLRGLAAFTIIELLVAIAVIGILSGLLVPGLRYARRAAHSAMCKSNLRQLGIAMALYVQCNGGKCMPISNDGGNLSFWFGRRPAPFGEPGYRDYDRTKGYLYEYLGVTRAVEQCPTMDAHKRAADGKLVGYAYNWRNDITAGLVTEGENKYITYYTKGVDDTILYDYIENPSCFALFADGARVSRGGAAYYTPAGTVEENYYLDPPGPGNEDCGVHFRHNGKANVLFADFHVEEMVPRETSPTGDGLVGHFCDTTDWVKYYCRTSDLGKKPLSP
jgi:prepilin-type processing-associated H-X9-DG protein/prepilin-type N-terminal cleavage/methylation domain-containing protein